MSIKTNEAISEFRKLMRTYEALQHAEAVMEALSEKERLSRETEAKLKALQEELETGEQRLTEVVEQYKIFVERKQMVMEEAENIKEASRKEASLIISKAQSEVNATKEKAESDISALRSTIKNLEKDFEKAKLAKEVAVNELEAVKKSIENTKQEFLKLLR